MLVDPTEANNNTPKQLDYLLVEDLCRHSAVPNSEMAAVTLRMMSRSNFSYGMKVLVETNIWHIEEDLVVKSHPMIGISCSH